MRIVACSHSPVTAICGDCLVTNSRHERISPAEAVARIRMAALVYDAANFDISDGWAIFNLPDTTEADDPSDYLDTSIERDDEAGIFAGDDQAVAHVAAMAATGSARHIAAIVIEGACNAIRAALWGEEWIDSRMGPPAIDGSYNAGPVAVCRAARDSIFEAMRDKSAKPDALGFVPFDPKIVAEFMVGR
jgi:hypothetical protein